MKKKLSIIIPCYNSEKFIERTISMLLSQDLTDCEIIFVNDGSTDKTLELLKRNENKFNNVKIISIENQGVSVARNVGIDHSDGNYLYFFDSDDFLAEDSLCYMKNMLVESSSDICSFGYTQKFGNKQRTYSNQKLDDTFFERNEFLKLYFLKKVSMHICSCIFRKDLIQNSQIRFTPGRKIGEDTEFILKAVLNSDRIYYSSRICYIYLLREDSVMGAYRKYVHSDSLENKIELVSDKRLRDLEIYCNYWLAYNYMFQLKNYIRSKISDCNYSEYYEKYKCLLRNRMYFNIKFYIMKTIVLVLPINFIKNIIKR